MYAIRSYYASSGTGQRSCCFVQKGVTIHGTLFRMRLHRRVPAVSSGFYCVFQIVITSYSIHYTKLYDDGDYDQMIALDITLVEAKDSRHVGRVVYTKRKGNGVKLFRTSGLYQLRISSTLARWTVRIDQLTPEEAEMYTPKVV